MNKLHWKKGIACGGMFLALLGLTFYILLSDQDPGKLWTALGQAEWSWLAVGAACMMLFFCCEAKNIQTGLGLFGSPAPYASCLLYAITGFFFSSVTPSASGGQPMQLYAMYRDGHAPAPGALALLTDFFSFQLAAVFWASVGFFPAPCAADPPGERRVALLCIWRSAQSAGGGGSVRCGVLSTGPSHSLGMADAASAPPFSPARRRLETLGRKAVEGFAAMYQVLPYP